MKINSILTNKLQSPYLKKQNNNQSNSINFRAKLPADLFQISIKHNENSITEVINKYVENFDKPTFDYLEFEEKVIKLNEYFSSLNDLQSLKRLYYARNPKTGKTIAHIANEELIKNINSTFKIDPAFLVNIYSSVDESYQTPIHGKSAQVIKEINEALINNKFALKNDIYRQKRLPDLKTPLHLAESSELVQINQTFKTNKEFMFSLHTTKDINDDYPINGKSPDFYKELFNYYNSSEDNDKLRKILLPSNDNKKCALLESIKRHPEQIAEFYDAFKDNLDLLKESLLSNPDNNFNWNNPNRLDFKKLAELFKNEPKMLAEIYSKVDILGKTPAFYALQNGFSSEAREINQIIGDNETLKKIYSLPSKDGSIISNLKNYQEDYEIIHDIFKDSPEQLLELYIEENNAKGANSRKALKLNNIAPILEIVKNEDKLLKKLVISQDDFGNNLLHYKLSSECKDILVKKDNSVEIIINAVKKHPEILKEALSATNLQAHTPVQLYNRRGDFETFFDLVYDIFKDEPSFICETLSAENMQNFSLFHFLDEKRLEKLHNCAKEPIDFYMLKNMHMINNYFNGYIIGSSIGKLKETVKFFENDPEFLANLFMLSKKNQAGSKEYNEIRNEIVKKLLADPDLSDEKSLELAKAYKEEDMYISLIYNYLSTKE